jgi:PAN domain
MSRFWRLVTATAAALGLAACLAHADVGFDRPGGDYDKFVLKSGDPAECALRCERDGRCHAWAFSYPRTETVEAVCWLKKSVPARVQNNCCVSGVRGAGVNEPISKDSEFGIDRSGGDYRNFETQPDSSGAACAKACKDEQRCRAWTYVRPGYQGSAAHCYLKAKIPLPRHHPCCISGVIR